MDYSGKNAVKKYVQDNRKDLMKLIRQDDTFFRALAIAMLLEGGEEVDIEMAKRELELLSELDGDYDDLY